MHADNEVASTAARDLLALGLPAAAAAPRYKGAKAPALDATEALSMPPSSQTY